MAAAFLANFLFWTGIAIGAVVFAALLDVTGGEWAGPLRTTAERFRRFLPLSFAAFVLLMWRARDVYPWAGAGRVASWWFRPWIVAARDAAALAAVYVCAFAFCRASDRARRDASISASRPAIVLILVYAVGFSLVVVDLVMSLEPRWSSTLFPAYVFSGNVYAGTAAVAALGAWRRPAPPSSRMRDMANLLVGLALFWVYLFWSQFLVIWYGNVTAEVGFMMARIDAARALGWIILVLCCVAPSIASVPQWGKRAAVVRLVAPTILVGLWLERWLLVAPDLGPPRIAPSIAVTIVFAIAFWISIRPEARERMS